MMIDDVLSSSYEMSCGLRQESVLDLLLHPVYVDSIRFYLSDSCLTSFADDTAVTFSSHCLDSLVLKVKWRFEKFPYFY